jgi:DNA repair protein RadC
MNKQIFKLHLKKELCPVAAELNMLGDPFSVKDIVALSAKLTRDEPREVKYAFYFNGPGQLIGYQEVAIGGMNHVGWDAKIVFASALLCGATELVLVHNHPMSTNDRFSPGDIRTFKGLIPGAAALGLVIRDNIVVCGDKYCSLREFGLMPNVGEVLKDAERESEKGAQS